MSFTAHTDVDGRRCRIDASGEIDLAVADEFAAAGITSLQDATVDTVLIDMGAVTFMDSTGLAALVHIRNEAVRLDKQLVLSHVPKAVRQILAITGVDVVFAADPAPDATDEEQA